MILKKVRQQFADTVLEVGQKDSRLVVLVGDISHFAMQPFAKACPGRYYNVGICEPTIMSMSAGVSKVGLIPVVHTISPFLIERSYEQIKLDFGYHELAGNIVTVGSAFDYGMLGCTHHCYSDFALMKPIQGTQIFYPGSSLEFDALFQAVYADHKINYFRVPEAQHEMNLSRAEIQPGRAIRVLEGEDLTIVALGPQLKTAVRAADILKGRGKSVEVLYLPTVKPLDSEAVLESLRKTRSAIVIEEHSKYGGVSDDVLRVAREIPGLKFRSQSLEDRFIHEYGTYDQHCLRLGFTPEKLIQIYEGMQG